MEANPSPHAELPVENAGLRARIDELQGQLVAMQEQLREQQLAAQLIDRLPSLIYVYDLIADHNLYSNRQIGLLLGYTPAQLPASGSGLLSDLIHPDDQETLAAARRRLPALSDDEPLVTEFRIRHANGSWRWLSDQAMVFRRLPDGRPSHTVGVISDITRQRAAEEALRESQIVLQGLIDHSPSPIFVKDLEGRLIVVNAALADSLGMDLAAMIGRRQTELFSPQSVAQWQAEDAQIIATGQTLTLEDINQGESSIRNFLTSKFPLMHADGTIFAIGGISTEITARRQMEQALEERERTTRALLNAPTDEIVLITPDGVISDANLAFVAAYGTTREALIGQPLAQICELEYSARLPELLAQLAREQAPLRFEGTYGGRFFDHLLAPIVATGGALTAVAIFSRDMTALKRGEIERLRIERRLLESQRMESIGVLAGGIAHDFNNLLTSVLGHAELLLFDVAPGSAEHASLEAIAAAARRAADLTGQLLAYAGKGRFVFERVQIDQLVDDTIALLRASLPRQITLSHTVIGVIPPVEADATQIRQVLLSLVRNATEAINEAGSIHVQVWGDNLSRDTLDQLAFGVSLPPGQYVGLAVSDTGSGMEAATLERIFDPFFTTRFTGRGLGLAAVQGIVRGHRGALQVQSAPGQGTTFQIWWPALAASPAPGPAQPQVAGATLRGAALVIDDEPPVRQVLARMLRSLGFQVHLAGSGPEALGLLAEQALQPAIALVDLLMPQMDGVAVAGALRRARPAMPVVLMSGYSAAEIAHEYHQPAIAGFLQKPFQLAALRGTLSQILGG